MRTKRPRMGEVSITVSGPQPENRSRTSILFICRPA